MGVSKSVDMGFPKVLIYPGGAGFGKILINVYINVSGNNSLLCTSLQTTMSYKNGEWIGKKTSSPITTTINDRSFAIMFYL